MQDKEELRLFYKLVHRVLLSVCLEGLQHLLELDPLEEQWPFFNNYLQTKMKKTAFE
jgi:hypothetical protein